MSSIISDIILYIIFSFLDIGIPVGIIVFFIVSLVLLKKTPKDSKKYKSRKNTFIVSALLAGILITVIVLSFLNADIILEGLFFCIPVGIIIFFIVSLILLKKTPKNSEKYESRKTAFIVSAVLTGILVTAVVALFIMTQMIIRYM
ncbi:MAG: hypothetical protein NC244_01265 [Alistipes senegalensis]|nr:hypothetical protein [Alistipes senegalensis]